MYVLLIESTERLLIYLEFLVVLLLDNNPHGLHSFDEVKFYLQFF